MCDQLAVLKAVFSQIDTGDGNHHSCSQTFTSAINPADSPKGEGDKERVVTRIKDFLLQ